MRDVLHRLNFPRDIFIDPRTRERNNVSDQLVPSLTQLGQANGQLVPHQLKPTTGKYLSSLRHLRSKLLVKSLPCRLVHITIFRWTLSVLSCSRPKCGLWCALSWGSGSPPWTSLSLSRPLCSGEVLTFLKKKI